MSKKPNSKKTSPVAIVLVSEEAMIGTLDRLVLVQLELKQRRAELDAQVAKLKAAFDESEAVQSAQKELALLESSVALFCATHRTELFPGERKSKDYQNATVGFRLNPPSVGKLLPRDTFEAIALRLADTDWGAQYVEWEPKLQKEALLRDRANLTLQQLQTAGLAFEQGETFYIEPASREIERIRKPAEEVAA